MLTLIIGIAVTGLIIGALGRLVIPGPNPMGIFSTILVGLAGSFLGGIIGRVLLGASYTLSIGLSLVISVLCTALIIHFIQKPKR